MPTEHDATQFVTKLTRLTSDDSIKWSFEEPPYSITRGTDDVFPLFFRTNYKGKNIAIYENRYTFFHADTESVHWTERVVLGILDDHENLIWEFAENRQALSGLLETVREKVANIDAFIDELLEDDS